ncbi:MAG: salt stress protein, Slr1339 family [Elainella sp.]
MSDPIDDLLAQIQPAQPKPAQPQPAAKLAPAQQPPAHTIEHLLAVLDDQPAPTSSQPSANPRFDALIHQTSAQPTPHPDGGSPDLFKAESADQMLADLKAIYQEQDQAEALRQQAALRTEQERQATLKRQQQGAIKRQAQDWLENLDTASGEAAWFEEFAAKYASRMEAAIDYLGLRAE